jgi:hypothetical protein
MTSFCFFFWPERKTSSAVSPGSYSLLASNRVLRGVINPESVQRMLSDGDWTALIVFFGGLDLRKGRFLGWGLGSRNRFFIWEERGSYRGIIYQNRNGIRFKLKLISLSFLTVCILRRVLFLIISNIYQYFIFVNMLNRRILDESVVCFLSRRQSSSMVQESRFIVIHWFVFYNLHMLLHAA